MIPIPSKAYSEYEKAAGWYLKPLGIDCPVNIKALYCMPTRRRVDKTNLESALCDVLVRHGVIADDNCRIVAATDGSRVLAGRPDYKDRLTTERAAYDDTQLRMEGV